MLDAYSYRMDDKSDSKDVKCEICPLDLAVSKIARLFRRK